MHVGPGEVDRRRAAATENGTEERPTGGRDGGGVAAHCVVSGDGAGATPVRPDGGVRS